MPQDVFDAASPDAAFVLIDAALYLELFLVQPHAQHPRALATAVCLPAE